MGLGQAENGRRVGGVEGAHWQPGTGDLGNELLEILKLGSCESQILLIGGGKMHVDAVDADIGQQGGLGDSIQCPVTSDTASAHARVNLDLDVAKPVLPVSGRRQQAGFFGRGDRHRDAARHGFGSAFRPIALARACEYGAQAEHWAGPAKYTKLIGLIEIGHSQALNIGVVQGRQYLGEPVAVGVCLDGDTDRCPGRDPSTDGLDVAPDGGGADVRGRWFRHWRERPPGSVLKGGTRRHLDTPTGMVYNLWPTGTNPMT